MDLLCLVSHTIQMKKMGLSPLVVKATRPFTTDASAGCPSSPTPPTHPNHKRTAYTFNVCVCVWN